MGTHIIMIRNGLQRGDKEFNDREELEDLIRIIFLSKVRIYNRFIVKKCSSLHSPKLALLYFSFYKPYSIHEFSLLFGVIVQTESDGYLESKIGHFPNACIITFCNERIRVEVKSESSDIK